MHIFNMISVILKIYLSYSNKDAEHFIEKICVESNNSRFNILNSIKIIIKRNICINSVKENISKCNLVVVIITLAYLQSQRLKNDILKLKKENKPIIFYFHNSIKNKSNVLNLENISSKVFEDEKDLAAKIQIDIKDFFILWNNERISRTHFDYYHNVNEINNFDFQRLQYIASEYAYIAIKRDSEGLHHQAILHYQGAIEMLISFVELYPEYKLNRIYLERAGAYQNRIKALQSAFKLFDDL